MVGPLLPEPDDLVYFTTPAGAAGRVMVTVDAALMAVAPVAGLWTLLTLSTPLLDPVAEGQVSTAESSDLTWLSVQIARAARHAGAVVAGSHYGSDGFALFLYTADAAATKAGLHPILAAAAHDFRAEITADPGWDTFRAQLCPDEIARHEIATARILDSLDCDGDDGQGARQITHRAVFPDTEAAAAFRAAITAQGYAPTDTPGLPAVTFLRHDSPAAMDAVTGALVRLTASLGGTYEGWRCEIMPGSAG